LNAGRRYLDQRLSLAQIDHRIGFSKGTAARLAHDYAILIRGGIDDNRRAHPALPRDWLFDQHVTHERGLVRAGAIVADRDPDSLRIVCRRIVHLDATRGRAPRCCPVPTGRSGTTRAGWPTTASPSSSTT
jgi:hypothetical protein